MNAFNIKVFNHIYLGTTNFEYSIATNLAYLAIRTPICDIVLPIEINTEQESLERHGPDFY